MNRESSRSHLIISIVVESTNLQTQNVTKGKLSFVDLAGSERCACALSPTAVPHDCLELSPHDHSWLPRRLACKDAWVGAGKCVQAPHKALTGSAKA